MTETTDETAKVLAGREGYLFLTNDTNRIIDQVEGSYVLDARQLWTIALAHAARRTLCEAHGARYDHIVVPDRETLLSQYLPEQVQPGRHGPRPIGQYGAIGADRVHRFGYELEPLQRAYETPSLFKGDTHWTCDGAIRYMRALLPGIGCDLAPYDAAGIKSFTYQNPGDLGSKLGSGAEEAAIRMPENAALKPIYDNALGNLGRMRLFRNPDRPKHERWLVLHDSFGEWLSLMFPMLAHTTCFVHTPDWDEVFALDFKPSRVLFLQIERFFVRTPLNGIDFDQLAQEQARAKGVAIPALDAETSAALFPNGRARPTASGQGLPIPAPG